MQGAVIQNEHALSWDCEPHTFPIGRTVLEDFSAGKVPGHRQSSFARDQGSYKEECSHIKGQQKAPTDQGRTTEHQRGQLRVDRFPLAARTNCHKASGLKQHTFIIQSWRSKILKPVSKTEPPAETCVCLFRCQVSTCAHQPGVLFLLYLLASASVLTSPLQLCSDPAASVGWHQA